MLLRCVCVCVQGCLRQPGAGSALVAFASNLESFPVTGLFPASDNGPEVMCLLLIQSCFLIVFVFVCVCACVCACSCVCLCVSVCTLPQGGLSLSFVLRMDPTPEHDDFIVSAFLQTLSLPSPNVLDTATLFAAGKKASSKEGTLSFLPIARSVWMCLRVCVFV